LEEYYIKLDFFFGTEKLISFLVMLKIKNIKIISSSLIFISNKFSFINYPNNVIISEIE
jgi:hypothetical protein